MPIDKGLFIKELRKLNDDLNKAMDFGRNGKYDKAIEHFSYVIASAGLLLQKDPEIGRLMKMDKTILVAKGFQLRAYYAMLEAEPEFKKEIILKMEKIARGNLDKDDPYFVKIKNATDEYTEIMERGEKYWAKDTIF